METLLTKRETIKRFREHWRSISEVGTLAASGLGVDDIKELALNVSSPTNEEIDSSCWLCEYHCQQQSIDFANNYCSVNCLIDWGTVGYGCIRGFYDSWCAAVGEAQYQRAADIARQIAELPTNSIYGIKED